MAMAADFSSWQGTWLQALALAWDNESFRQALLDDARSAIKTHLNVEIPGTFPIRVVEGSDRDHVGESVLTIPSRRVAQGQEADVLARYAKDMLTDSAIPCIC
jgi:ribosomally synthesized peptide (two-chain TOMM family)